jgi:hypothetical protein
LNNWKFLWIKPGPAHLHNPAHGGSASPVPCGTGPFTRPTWPSAFSAHVRSCLKPTDRTLSPPPCTVWSDRAAHVHLPPLSTTAHGLSLKPSPFSPPCYFSSTPSRRHSPMLLTELHASLAVAPTVGCRQELELLLPLLPPSTTRQPRSHPELPSPPHDTPRR